MSRKADSPKRIVRNGYRRRERGWLSQGPSDARRAGPLIHGKESTAPGGAIADLWEPFGGDMWDEVRENIARFRASLREE